MQSHLTKVKVTITIRKSCFNLSFSVLKSIDDVMFTAIYYNKYGLKYEKEILKKKGGDRNFHLSHCIVIERY